MSSAKPENDLSYSIMFNQIRLETWLKFMIMRSCLLVAQTDTWVRLRTEPGLSLFHPN